MLAEEMPGGGLRVMTQAEPLPVSSGPGSQETSAGHMLLDCELLEGKRGSERPSWDPLLSTR